MEIDGRKWEFNGEDVVSTMATTWRLLLLTAAAAAASTIMANTLPVSKELRAMSCASFVSSPSTPFCRRDHVRHHPLLPTKTLSPSEQTPLIALAMSKPSNLSLQQQIIQGAAMKLLEEKDASTSYTPTTSTEQSNPTASKKDNTPKDEEQYSYYVREGHRSEMNEITDALMDSFHPGSNHAFDSYIRRYKYNHLQMCFDAIEESDRGLYVACVVPTAPSSSSPFGGGEKEQIIGFCSVDGRPPDPSCKIENLTPSTLAGTSPRPYLSDLGVSTLHRRRGIGEKLVRACEQWTHDRGYEKLYLKVDKKNVVGVSLYSAMGYKQTRLPWVGGKDVPTSTSKWDTTMLMEKSVKDSMHGERRKRTWIKNQLWKPIKKSVVRYSARVNKGPPL